MDAVFVPYSNRYKLSVTEQELKTLREALLGDCKVIEAAVTDTTPEPFKAASKDWIRRRKEMAKLLAEVMGEEVTPFDED